MILIMKMIIKVIIIKGNNESIFDKCQNKYYIYISTFVVVYFI